MLSHFILALAFMGTVHWDDSIYFSARKESKNSQAVEVDGQSVNLVSKDLLIYASTQEKVGDLFPNFKRDFATRADLLKYAKENLCGQKFSKWFEVTASTYGGVRVIDPALNPWINSVTAPEKADYISIELRESSTPEYSTSWPIHCRD